MQRVEHLYVRRQSVKGERVSHDPEEYHVKGKMIRNLYTYPCLKVEMNACKKTELVKQRLKELSSFSYLRTERKARIKASLLESRPRNDSARAVEPCI